MKKSIERPGRGAAKRGKQILVTVSRESTAGHHIAVEAAFGEVVGLIRAARQRADQAVNTGVIDLYWSIGQYLHHKIEADGWAKGTVVQLAGYIAQREPGKRGFSSQNLWRMRQFFEAYPAASKLSPLLRDLPWSAHLHILSRAKRAEGRAMLNPPKLSTALREMQPQADQGETVWLSQPLMADLFGATQLNVSLHLQNLYEEDELQPVATHKECLSVRREGAREVLPYTPDAWVNNDATKVSFTRHFYEPQPLLCWSVRRRLSKGRPQGGRAAHGKQILVTVSRDLTVDHGRYFKRKLGALLEGAPT